MPEPINLHDISKNPKHIREGLKEWSQCNPAEHLEAMERRGELKRLKAKSFDRAYRPRLSVNEPQEPKQEAGHGFRAGDRVIMTDQAIRDAALTGDKIEGVVQGVRGGFVIVNGVHYTPDRWRKE